MKNILRRLGVLLLCVSLMSMTALAGAGDLMLVSPMFQEANYIAGEEFDEGYIQSFSWGDGLFFIEVQAIANTPEQVYPMIGGTSFEDFMFLRYEETIGEGMEVVECDPVSSYPAQRLRFTAGGNEDMVVINALAVWTEGLTFVFIIETDADTYYGFNDAYAADEAETFIEDWIASLEIFDANESMGYGENDWPTETVTLVADFSIGSADGVVEKYEMNTNEIISVELLADGLSALTGLDFFVTGYPAEDGIYVEWLPESTLLAGLNDREQNEAFFFYDADSLNWFMLDSLYATLKEYYGFDVVFYTMNGGEALAVTDLSPISGVALGTAYMGSPFYFAHADVVGE